jgi:hypothetical protein
VPVGWHTVSYAPAPRWTPPLSEDVAIAYQELTAIERTCVQRSYTLTIAVDPPGSGTVVALPLAGDDGRYVQDTVVALTAQPQPGFQVSVWTGADSVPATGADGNTVTMRSDRPVLVQFEVMPFHVYQLAAAVAGGQGWISPTRGAYREGEVVPLTATPATDFEVATWSGTDDDASFSTTNTVTMTGHKSVSVSFGLWQDCNGNGISDRLDIATGTSQDCDGNGVPDECQPDTDADGVIDACDPDTPTPPAGNLGGPGNTPPPFALCGWGAPGPLALCVITLVSLRPRRPFRPGKQ